MNVLFLTTGETRMRNVMECLRSMPKPNRAEHGGKGLFWFCETSQFRLDVRLSALARIWIVATGTRSTASLIDQSPLTPTSNGRVIV